LKSRIRDSVQSFIRHNNKRVINGIHVLFQRALNVQNAVVESTSIVGTIEAINLRNTTR